MGKDKVFSKYGLGHIVLNFGNTVPFVITVNFFFKFIWGGAQREDKRENPNQVPHWQRRA